MKPVYVSDLPRVTGLPVQVYLARRLPGRIDCPVEGNPPVTLVVWAKNERIIDPAQVRRMRVNRAGTLLIQTVEASDEGRYTCTPFSPLGAGRTSTPLQLLVRGLSYRISYWWYVEKRRLWKILWYCVVWHIKIFWKMNLTKFSQNSTASKYAWWTSVMLSRVW